MRDQWKPKDKLRKGKHKKQGDISQEERTTQTKSYLEDLKQLEKQLVRRAQRVEKRK